MQQQSKHTFTRTLLASSLSLAFFGQTAFAEELVNELSKVEVTADKENDDHSKTTGTKTGGVTAGYL
jgi:hypothetical protein